jgi:hypothetical protein
MGDLDGAGALLARWDVAGEDPGSRLLAGIMRAGWLKATGRLDEARRQADEVGAVAMALGGPTALGGASYVRGNVSSGSDPAAAVRAFEETVRVCTGLSQVHYGAELARRSLVDLAARNDDPVASLQLCRAALVDAAGSENHYVLACLLEAAATALVRCGRAVEAEAVRSCADPRPVVGGSGWPRSGRDRPGGRGGLDERVRPALDEGVRLALDAIDAATRDSG